MARKTTSTTKATTPRKKTTSTARKELPSVPVAVKPRKPVFSAGTWITLLVLAILIGATIYLNRKKETAATDAIPTSEEITTVFDTADGTVSSIEIKPAEGEAVRIARNEQNAWAIELPLEAEADQGLAEAAATQIFALKVISPIDGKADVFGLDNPAYTITIEFAGGARETHTLEIGDSTPTNSGYYVRVDKDKMMITDLSGIDSLLQLVNFPPYLNTPTPTPLPPTETPVPPTEVRGASTPEATVTPTP